MQFKKGADVVTADGDKVGDVDRVVIDPRTRAVTHVIVRKGFLFKEDKVVPVSMIASSTEERLTLQRDADDFDTLPAFEEQRYVPLTENERERAPFPEGREYVPPLYWYPTYGGAYSYPIDQPAYATEVTRNIPEDTVALKEGASVIDRDGNHVGNVDQVITDDRDERVTHVVIAEGMLLMNKKVVPALWIDVVTDDEVHLVVGSEFLKSLPDHTETV